MTPGKGSRIKGATAELEVANLLQDWWRALEPGCAFKRTPGSGGWGNPEVRGEFKTSGDLVTTAKRFPFSIEVKRRENWALSTVIKGKPSPVWNWWEQAKIQGVEMHKEPMLLLRHSREKWRCLLAMELSRLLELPWLLVTNPVGEALKLAYLEDLLVLDPLYVAAKIEAEQCRK